MSDTPQSSYFTHTQIFSCRDYITLTLYETPNNLDFCGIIDEALKAFGGNLLLDSWRNHRNQGRDLNLDNEFYLYLCICIFVFEFAFLYLCIFVFSFCICESAFVYLYFYIYVFAVGIIREIGAQSLNLDQDLIGHRSLRFSSVSDSSLYF